MEGLEKTKSLPQLIRPKSSGVIKVYSNLDEDITNKVFKESSNFYPWQSAEKIKQNFSTDVKNRVASSTSSSGNSNNIKEWINRKSLSNIRDEKSATSTSIQKVYGRVLSNEENFVKGIEEFLVEQDLLRLRKKEILYRKWQDRVYIPLRKEVEKAMEDKFSLLDSQRRREYLNYIQHRNIKRDVFLDAYSPNEYDPFVIYNPHSAFSLHARTSRLNDPLLKSERRRLDEEKVLVYCESGSFPSDQEVRTRRLPPQPLIPLGRDGNKNSSWLSLSLQNSEGPDRLKGRQESDRKLNASEIDFEAWSKTSIDRDIVDREMRIQKKRHFEVPSSMPSEEVLKELEPIKKNTVRFADAPFISNA